MKKYAVVTGANGWLGKSLCNFLANGHSDNDQLDRKRSHKRRRKIRKPIKGLR